MSIPSRHSLLRPGSCLGRSVAALATCLALVAGAAEVAAQPPPPAQPPPLAQPPPPAPTQVEAADAEFKKGQIALEAGRLDEACAAFAESLRLDVGVGALLNLARCHRLQGKILQAHREYGEAVDLATKAGQNDRADAARAVVAELGAVLPRLRIEIADPAPGLAVTIDGQAVDAAKLAEPMTIEVGPHEVVATAPGRVDWRGTAEVRSQAEPVVLRVPGLAEPGASAPPAESGGGDSGLVTGGIIVGGVGVAALVVGSIFGVMTLSDASTARDDPALCPDEHCTDAGRAVIDDAETKGVVSTIAIGVGAAAVVAGVVMIVVGLPGDDAPASDAASVRFRLAPEAAPGDAGLAAVLRF